MSFKDYILNVHPDPDFLGDKKVYDAYDELDRLAQNYAKDKISNLTKELQEAEIKRLTKEVGELREWTNEQLEVLGEAKEYIEIYGAGGDEIDHDDIIDKINNALNHKP